MRDGVLLLLLTSPDIVGSVPTWAKTGITLALNEDDNVVKGNYVFEYWLTNGVSNYYFSKTYDFQYVTPDVDIELTVSCRTSELSSEDVTEYDIDGISPTITRTHTITQPIGGGMSPVPVYFGCAPHHRRRFDRFNKALDRDMADVDFLHFVL